MIQIQPASTATHLQSSNTHTNPHTQLGTQNHDLCVSSSTNDALNSHKETVSTHPLTPTPAPSLMPHSTSTLQSHQSPKDDKPIIYNQNSTSITNLAITLVTSSPTVPITTPTREAQLTPVTHTIQLQQNDPPESISNSTQLVVEPVVSLQQSAIIDAIDSVSPVPISQMAVDNTQQCIEQLIQQFNGGLTVNDFVSRIGISQSVVLDYLSQVQHTIIL